MLSRVFKNQTTPETKWFEDISLRVCIDFVIDHLVPLNQMAMSFGFIYVHRDEMIPKIASCGFMTHALNQMTRPSGFSETK